MNSLIKNVEGKIAKHNAAKEQAGEKCHAYTAQFKVQVIIACDEGATQGSVAEKCRISQSQVSRWIVKRKEIMKYAASKHRKLFKKVANLRST